MQSDPRQAMKHNLVVLVASTGVLHAVMATVFFVFHFDHPPGPRQNTFIGVWMILAALIVAVQLRRIRKARLELMRPRGGSGGPTSGS